MDRFSSVTSYTREGNRPTLLCVIIGDPPNVAFCGGNVGGNPHGMWGPVALPLETRPIL